MADRDKVRADFAERQRQIARRVAYNSMLRGEPVSDKARGIVGREGLSDIAGMVAGVRPDRSAYEQIYNPDIEALKWQLRTGQIGEYSGPTEIDMLRGMGSVVRNAYNDIPEQLGRASTVFDKEAKADDVYRRAWRASRPSPAPAPAPASGQTAPTAAPVAPVAPVAAMPPTGQAISPFALGNPAGVPEAPRLPASAPQAARGSEFPSGGILIYGNDGGRYGGEARVVTNLPNAQAQAQIRALRNKPVPAGMSFSDAPIPSMDAPIPAGMTSTPLGTMFPAQAINTLRGMEEDAATAAAARSRAESQIASATGYDLTRFGMPQQSQQMLSGAITVPHTDGRPKIVTPSGKAYLDEGDVVAAYSRREITRSEFQSDLDFVRRYTLAVRDQGQAFRAAAEQGSAAYNSMPYEQAAAMQAQHEQRLAATPLAGSPRSNEYYRQKADFYTAPINRPTKADPARSFSSGLESVVRDIDNIIDSPQFQKLTPFQQAKIYMQRAGRRAQAIQQQIDQANMMYEQGQITKRQLMAAEAAARREARVDARLTKSSEDRARQWFIDSVQSSMKTHLTNYNDREDESPYYNSTTGRIDRNALRAAMEAEIRQMSGSPEQGGAASPFASAANDFSMEIAP